MSPGYACLGIVIKMNAIHRRFAGPSRMETSCGIDNAAVVNQISCRIVVADIVPGDFKIHTSRTTSVQGEPSNVEAATAAQCEHGAACWTVPQNGGVERILAEDGNVLKTSNTKRARDDIGSIWNPQYSSVLNK